MKIIKNFYFIGLCLFFSNIISAETKTTRSRSVKDFAVERVVVPALIKWEEIKDDGLDKKDLAKIGACGVLIGAAIKLNIKDKIKKLCNLIRTDISSMLQYCWSSKRQTAVTAACIAAPFILWKAYKHYTVDKTRTKNCIGQFLLTLTDEQKDIINNSSEFYTLISKSGDNPKLLTDNAKFVSILEESQRNQLSHIVEHYSQS